MDIILFWFVNFCRGANFYDDKNSSQGKNCFMTYINGELVRVYLLSPQIINKEKDPKSYYYSFRHFGDTPCIHDCIIREASFGRPHCSFTICNNQALWCHVVRCGTALVVVGATHFLSFFLWCSSTTTPTLWWWWWWWLGKPICGQNPVGWVFSLSPPHVPWTL